MGKRTRARRMMKKLKNLIKTARVSLQVLIKILANFLMLWKREILVCRSKNIKNSRWHFHLIYFLTFTNSSIRRELNSMGIFFFAVKRRRKGREKSEREKKQINFTFLNSLFLLLLLLLPVLFWLNAFLFREFLLFFWVWKWVFFVCLESFERVGNEFFYKLFYKALKSLN